MWSDKAESGYGGARTGDTAHRAMETLTAMSFLDSRRDLVKDPETQELLAQFGAWPMSQEEIYIAKAEDASHRKAVLRIPAE